MTIYNCPHCGGESFLNQTYSHRIGTFFVFVKCDICHSQGKVFKSDAEPAANEWNTAACRSAVKAWNMRTPLEGATEYKTYNKFMNHNGEAEPMDWEI